MEKVFIYGTLKNNQYNNYVMGRVAANKLADVTTVEKYPMFMLRDAFPWLQDTKGTGKNITGEMFEVPEEGMAVLDNFEGVDRNLYKRGTIKVTDGEAEYNVSVYFRAKELTETQLNMLVMLDNYQDKLVQRR